MLKKKRKEKKSLWKRMCTYNILQCASFHSSLWNDWFPHSCWFAPDMIQPFIQFSNFAFSTDKFHQPCIIVVLPLLYFFTITQDVRPSLQLSLSTKSFQMSHDLHDGGSVPLMSLLWSLVSSSSLSCLCFLLYAPLNVAYYDLTEMKVKTSLAEEYISVKNLGIFRMKW